MKLRARYLLNPLFLCSLAMLLVNDFFLKEHFHNVLTGKLSDVSGIVVLFLFLLCCFGDHTRPILVWSVAAFFVYWKSPFSQCIIDCWNTLIPGFQMSRVVDYSDLICLLLLWPLSFYTPGKIFLNHSPIAFFGVLSLTLFSLMSTSRARYFPAEKVYVNEFIRVKLTREAFLDQLVKDGASWTRDSIYIFAKDTFQRYEVSDLFLKSDTVSKAFIGLCERKRKTEVYIEWLMLSPSGKDVPIFEDHKDYNKWQKKYRVESIQYFRKNR
jgi:hypothetical protein